MSRRIAAIAVCALLVATAAGANMMDMYGYGPRASAMGMAYVGLADDWNSIYYNPAGIVLAPKNEISGGYFLAVPELDLDLEPDASAAPEHRDVINFVERQQEEVTDLNGYTLGGTFQFTDWLAAGVGLFIPEGLVVRLQPSQTRLPTFQFHENYGQRTVVLFAASVRPIPELTLGVGVSFFADVDGRLRIPVAVTNQNTSLDPDQPAQAKIQDSNEFTIEFPAFFSPYGGIRWQATDWFSVGASYRGEYRWDVRLDVDASLNLVDYTVDLAVLEKLAPDLFPLEAVISVDIPQLGGPLDVPITISELVGELTVTASLPVIAHLQILDFWKPQEISLGTAFTIADRFTITADGVWYNWSAMPKPDMKIEIEDITVNLSTLPTTIRTQIERVSLPVLGTLGPLPELAIGLPAIDLTLTLPLDLADAYEPRAHDIFVPRVGFEARFGPTRELPFFYRISGALRAGYSYQPSPFSKPNGFSNIIALDRHTFTFGGGMSVFGFVTLDAFGQFHYLEPMEATRDFLDADIPYRKLSASGYVLAGGVSATVTW